MDELFRFLEYELEYIAILLGNTQVKYIPKKLYLNAGILQKYETPCRFY